MKISCTICRELFLSAHIVLVTNCGHLYHKSCISQWSDKQHSCPQCRAKLVFQPIRVYFNIEDDLNNSCEEGMLETKFSDLNDKFYELTIQHKVISAKLTAVEEECQQLTEKLTKSTEECSLKDMSISSLKVELNRALVKSTSIDKLKQDYKKISEENQMLKSVDALLNGSELSVKKTLENTPLTLQSLRQLITYVEVLKHQSVMNSNRYKESSLSQKRILQELASLKCDNDSLKASIEEYKLQSQNPKPKTPPSTTPLTECINLCSPVIPDLRIKLLDKLEVMKRSTFSSNPSNRFSHLSTSKSPSPGFEFDGMGGSKRISLATPTPAAELLRIRAMKHLAAKPKTAKPVKTKTRASTSFHVPMDVSLPDSEFIELD